MTNTDTQRPDERVESLRQTLDSLASLGLEDWSLTDRSWALWVARDMIRRHDEQRARAERAEQSLNEAILRRPPGPPNPFPRESYTRLIEQRDSAIRTIEIADKLARAVDEMLNHPDGHDMMDVTVEAALDNYRKHRAALNDKEPR